LVSVRQARFRKSSLVKAAGILIILAAFTISVAHSDYIGLKFAHYKIERLIRNAESGARTTLGRLSNAPYAALTTGRLDADTLGKAQLALLAVPDSIESKFLQTHIDIGTHDWQKAADALLDLSSRSADPRILNDLGVVLVQLAEQEPLNYFKALNAFDQALTRQPDAPEPHFNKALILRKLQFSAPAEKVTANYLNGKEWRLAR
jgi:hypothetical protein